MTATNAALLQETLELQITLLQLQTSVTTLSRQVQTGISAVSQVVELASRSATQTAAATKDDVAKTRAAAMAAVAAASANAIGLIGTGNPNDPQSNQVWNRYSPHSGLSQSGPSTASPADQSVPDRYQYHAHLLSTTPNPTGFSPIELLDTKPKMKESKHEDSEGRCDLVQAVPGVSVALQPALSTVFDESSRTILQSDSAHDGKYEKIERPENFIISHASAGPSRTTIIDLPRVTSFKNTHQTSMNDSHISLGIKWDSLDYETVQKPPVAILSDGDLLRLGKASPPIRYSTTNSRSQIARRSRSFGLFSSSGPSPESLLGTEIEALPIYNPSILQQKIRLKNKFLEKVRDSKLANASMDVPQKNSNTLTVNSSIKSRKYFDTKVGDQDTGKWAKLRRSTIAQTGMATSDITLDAVFPEMKPQCNLSAEERKHRALEYWCKLRKAVFTYDQNKFEILGKLAITALPDLAKLHEKAQSNISDINVVVPYNTWSARMHWLFMCPAFDDDTEWMSIQKYHTWEYRLHKFSIDGFNPFSIFYSFCNGMLLCFYVYILVVLPYQIAYEDNIDDLIDTENAIAGMFIADSLINLLTPQKPPKTETREKVKRPDLKKWMMRYGRKYWLIDVITVISWIRFIPPTKTVYFPIALIHLLRCFRLPKMASRSPAILNLHKRVEAISGIGSILTRMIPVGVLVLYFIHLQACVLFYFGKVTGFMTWDAQFSHWQLFEGGISASSEAERYIWMLSQSVGNMFQTTFKPETLPEQILTMIFIIIGAFMYAVLVGLISSAAISYDASGRLYRQKIDQLTEYLSWKNVDAETRKKLLGYYEFKYKGKYFEETGIFKDMNESLRRQLASLNCKQLIEKVPFLKRECLDGRDGLYLGKIATALVPIYFVTGDSIIEQGEQATDMFFILTGRVNVLVNDHAVTTISDGGFFGEVALIANIPRTASVKAATNCYCYSLSAKDFYAIIVEFPDVRVRIDKIYEERMAKVRMEQAARLFMGGEKLSGSLRASPTPSVRRTFNE